MEGLMNGSNGRLPKPPPGENGCISPSSQQQPLSIMQPNQQRQSPPEMEPQLGEPMDTSSPTLNLAGTAASSFTGTPDFKLSQCFGDCSPADEVTDADILSAVQFDSTGQYLATGDRGGRVVLFKQNSVGKQKVSSSGKIRRTSDYKFYTEFQSHEAEFDYLKSLEIEEKINQIKWCPRATDALFLLSTNDKTVKLWKVREKKVRRVATMALPASDVGGNNRRRLVTHSSQLQLPKMEKHGTQITATPRRIFSNAHAYHVNSVAPNSDGEHFLSADDLRINLWNMEITDRSFNIVDIKPKNMEELTEVITSAACHPTSCNVFMYSSSRGSIKMGDMRASALCDRHAKVMEEKTEPGNKSFFSEIVASISDIKSSVDGRYIFSRDYMTVKVWDVNMESRPLQTIQIHNHLRSQLSDLYENDCIFDKFECAANGEGTVMLTGSYNNLCQMFDRYGQTQAMLEVSKDPAKRSSRKKTQKMSKTELAQALVSGPIDYDKKILHMSWHPKDDIIAVAGLNKLFIYTAQR